MITTNDRIRRELGFDLVKAARESGAHANPEPVPPQPAKTQAPEKVVTILDND